jgi:hypothetical protein
MQVSPSFHPGLVYLSPKTQPKQSVYAVDSEPLAAVLFTPTGTTESTMGFQLDSRGNLFRQELYGKKKMGHITPQGYYQLENGQQGDVFEPKHSERNGLMDIDLANQDHPFINLLRLTERQRSLVGSESLYLRSVFNRYGLTGQGVKIGLFDPYESIE